ncbi:HIT family protein [Leuconostoc falkenbergense]|jgi:histidine triad (HIT) family protein|uniref:HIT domain-containing protein n=1 Tax=Leuconostoc falkenbergense TaxID=2766470 RepID=A0A9X3E933_9LACO|nr:MULTISPECIES: HIT family protein [Leuconostoc]RDG20299.1 diadenosine tetraphosphate hydrolase [Leuconostoc pseudomesenteroides]MCT4390016.1 HIT family protein [Leuconostoc falkenbergense]MCT4411275.1 HIT family protein [Leuconostoc falkenbergense]MCX7579152.1 HIT domain-containing protein [Leuconostoc falkenbergense]MDM7645822.1 HIT family protein [Leuconostoc falkenbergense]
MDIFDKIIAGEIPSYTVYEDEDVLAFLDISQVTPGHTLLVPKADVADIFDYTDDIAKKVLLKLPVVAAAVKASNPDITGINIQSNNGVSAGQTVRHSHWHIIPRFDDDNLNSKLAPTIDNSSAFSPERYQKIADSIAAQF